MARAPARPDALPSDRVLRWWVSADETGVHGSRYYGFGTLWMSWQRRGDFAGLISTLRVKHRYESEIKWERVTRQSLPFYRDLVERFFQTNWLSFHCCLVEKAVVRKELHQNDYDLARRKHFGMLLTKKIQACIKAHPDREHTFRVYVDPIHSRYSKADETAEIVANNVLAKVLRKRPVDTVLTRDSATTPSIQLCDLLLGAVHAGKVGEASSAHKLELLEWVAHHLGWKTLQADTWPEERKFNIWVFHDPMRQPRRTSTVPVKLVYALPGAVAKPPRARGLR